MAKGKFNFYGNFCVILVLILSICFQYFEGTFNTYIHHWQVSTERLVPLTKPLQEESNHAFASQHTTKNTHLSEVAEEESEEKHKQVLFLQLVSISQIYWSSNFLSCSFSLKELKTFNLKSLSTKVPTYLINEVFRL